MIPARVPATAKIMWGQSSSTGQTQAAGYFGNHFHNLGVTGPGDTIPGLTDTGGGSAGNANTGSSINVFDPTPLGVASVYQLTEQSTDGSIPVEKSSNILWLWDLQAIAADAGGAVFTTDAVLATLELSVVGSHAPTGPVSQARVHVTDTPLTDLVEPAVAPHVLADEGGGFPFQHWLASPYAWAEPSMPDPGRPDAWRVSGVADPAGYWGSQWAGLMTPGGPAGSVMRLPQMPIRPTDQYRVADRIAPGTTGTWTTTIPLGPEWVAHDRWLGVWVSTEVQAEWVSYRNGRGAEPTDDVGTWWDFDVTAYLTVPVVASRVVPPLQQAARLLGGQPLLQRSREVRTQLLTARGRF